MKSSENPVGVVRPRKVQVTKSNWAIKVAIDVSTDSDALQSSASQATHGKLTTLTSVDRRIAAETRWGSASYRWART